VVIDNLTIKGGAGTSAGGGLRCTSSVLTLTSSVLSNNSAPGGGGLYAGGCILDVHDVTFSHNDAGTANGGGALLEGSTGILRNSTFTTNVGEHGGGLNMIEGHVAVLANDFGSNHGGSEGGGIWSASDAEIGGNHIHDNAGGWTAGGLYVFQHAPLVHDNVITGNTSGNDGAGIYLHISSATVRHNTISNNTSDDDAGGLRVFESPALIESNTIENNVAADGGGGIKVSHVPAHFVGNIVRGNRAGTGGGFMMDDDASTVTGGEVSGNTASGGGAFYIDLAPWTGAHLSGILISGNHAWIGGGLMITSNIETVHMDALTIVGNDATNIGGAILARGTDYQLTHSLVAHNSALQGGAIYHGLADPWTDPCPCPDTVTVGKVEFTTFVGNTSTHGDATAIYAESDGLTVENSIFSAHTGTSVTVAAGAPITFRYNDLQPATFSGMSSPVGSNGNLSVDPGFVNAAANDFHLTNASACKNAGDPALMDGDGSRADLGMYGGM
jgi:parallel beta-helix repeat protein